MGSNGISWRAFWQGILRGFLSVHFIVTVVILYFWIDAVGSPVTALRAMISTLFVDGANDLATAGRAIEIATQATVALSGIFTTVLGLVLGHYFGQRGQESAEVARDKAEQMREQLIEDFGNDRDLIQEELNLLDSQLADANSALFDAARQIAENQVPIDTDTPFSSYIHARLGEE